MAFMLRRSTTPRNESSAPIGTCSGTGTTPRRSRIMSTTRQKSAPVRSSLFTKQKRGTRYLSAWRQTVSDCGSTPATPSKTTTAPSSTRRLRSTSTVKSTWPGVSMMLMRWSPQNALVALADLVDLLRVEEDPLGHGRLARVDVGDDSNVPRLRERNESCHGVFPGSLA